MKLLEHRGNVHNIKFGNDFLDMLPKAQASKAKINKGDYSKFKDFCTASEKKINKVKKEN